MRKRRQTSFGLVLALVALLGGQIIFGTPVFGVTDSTISISTNTSLALSLMPGAFGSTSQSVTVTTNNYTGYTVQLTNPNNATELVNTNNNNYTIPTVTLPQGSNSITANQFSVGYGFSTDGTNYVPAPNSSSNISLGNRSTAGSSSHSLYLGVKSAGDAAAGTYSKAYTITAVVNNPQYSITYDANAGNDTVTGMPSNVSVTPSSTGTVTLSSDTPTRSNYTFLGWDTSSSATTPTYATGNTNTITLEPTLANAITLYAIWEQAQSGGGTWDDPIEDASSTYNPDDVPANSTVKYTEVAGEPQVSTDSNGNITRFEYTNTGTSGLELPASGGVDTGILAFDGNGFIIVLEGTFPWTTENRKPIVSLSGLVNGATSGFVLSNSRNSQKYTNRSGSRITTNATINRFRCFEYANGTLNTNTTRDLIYNNSSYTTSTAQNTLGWTQSEISSNPAKATLVITGTPNGSAININAKAYSSYNKETGTGTLLALLPANFVYSISGLSSSDITIELGHYELGNQTFDYSFTVHSFSVKKTTTP